MTIPGPDPRHDRGFPPPREEHRSNGNHRLMMILCCIPMLLIAGVLLATGVAGSACTTAGALGIGLALVLMLLLGSLWTGSAGPARIPNAVA